MTRKLALRIADRLLTNGFNESGGRLVIMNGARDLGGWCRDAIATQIEDTVERAEREKRKRRSR